MGVQCKVNCSIDNITSVLHQLHVEFLQAKYFRTYQSPSKNILLNEVRIGYPPRRNKHQYVRLAGVDTIHRWYLKFFRMFYGIPTVRCGN